MLTINLFDSEFPSSASCVNGKTPQLLRYVREQREFDGVTLFTDRRMFVEDIDSIRCPHKIGWILEARELRPWYYENIIGIEDKFEYILTYDAELLSRNPQKYRFYPRGGVWTPRDEWGIYPKSKNFSMILSEKNELSGHKLRHQIASMGLPIDLYGPEYTPIGTNKSLALRDYRFSIVVEASRAQNFFTEHLLDCIAFGTIPVYWGCPNIERWFDVNGIMKFNDIDFVRLLCANEQDGSWFNTTMLARYTNLYSLPLYEITDDWIAQHYLC